MRFEVDEKLRLDNARYCAERGILLPTLAMMRQPELIPERVKEALGQVGLWDVHPANLFRISWKNQPVPFGGGFGPVNHVVFPPELTGTPARIILLSGKWFPTGAHKVGATFGCLVPPLVSGQFNPRSTKAVWPSTGNYCRGGAYLSALLSCQAIAILPEGMSRERFDWLRKIAGEVLTTSGSESNVKEIFDKCWELRRSGQDLRIFNQFEEMGNPLWHYNVTGPAAREVLNHYLGPDSRFAGFVSSSGSGGTLAAGSYLKECFPKAKVIAAEALQCPTLLRNGFGEHRIEGIGDKHVPWIHHVRDSDFVIAVDDEHPVRLIRLFNEPLGREALRNEGVDPALIEQLGLLGISGVGNLLAAIKFAKYHELGAQDYVVSVATDSMELYGSRMEELSQSRGEYSPAQAQRDVELLHGQGIDHVKELGYYDRKVIHNLKYFTWVEQQGREVEELNRQWNEPESYWKEQWQQGEKVDRLIEEFNDLVVHCSQATVAGQKIE